MQPNGKWHIHDGKRPQPRIVAPGDGVAATPVTAPAGRHRARRSARRPQRVADDGRLAGDVGDEQRRPRNRQGPDSHEGGVHRLFSSTSSSRRRSEVKGDSQGRGNSGVFLLGKFEIQVLDSYHNPTYPDGQAAAMYGQYPPLVNASRPPGEWQTYDIVFTAPRFTAGGTLEKPAVGDGRSTTAIVVHNAHAVLGTDRAQEDRSVHAGQRERADRAAGSRQPGALPEHLDQAALRARHPSAAQAPGSASLTFALWKSGDLVKHDEELVQHW